MNDKELLELAAKAAGIEIYWCESNSCYWLTDESDSFVPLDNDGDALRLAVALSVDISHNDCQDNNRYVCVYRKGTEMCYGPIKIIEEFEDEAHRLYATRRAIVRAAAEIGKEMK